MSTIQEALTVYRELSSCDRISFYITLTDPLHNISDQAEGLLWETRYADGLHCPHCDSDHYVKNGRRKDGKQRYLCRECRHSFLATSDSILSGTHKAPAVWRRYLSCMFEQKTLKASAETCGISLGTAFQWRHKILDALKETESCIRLAGIVEADETYTPLSFKGNHKNSCRFSMPRPAHKRGKDIHTPGLSNEMVCIPCAVDRSGVPVSGVGKLGKVSSECIATVFRDRLLSGTVLCSDHEKAYFRFSGDSGCILQQTGTDRHVRGDYGVQRINSYHSRLKRFLRHMNGVSTKYLPNYLVWHDLMFCMTRRRTELEQEMFGSAVGRKIRIRCRELSSRPAIPTMIPSCVGEGVRR